MLRQSRINPKLSAHDQVFGTFNYQRTPLALLGTKVIIHKRPDQRKLWDTHGLPGFLVNRAKDHFQSYQVSVTKTGATRISDAIKLLPTKYTMPKTSFNDPINAAFKEIAEALNNLKLRGGFLNGNKESKILNGIVNIFDKQKDAHLPRVSQKPNPDKITHVPARVNHDSLPTTKKTDRRPRVSKRKTDV